MIHVSSAIYTLYLSTVFFQVFGKLKKYTQIPGFEPEKVGQVSTACKSICQWVLALEHYIEVKKVRIP